VKLRIVVKVGSAVLTDNNKIATSRMLEMIEFIAELKKSWDVLLVSSGAVASGYDVLKIDKNFEMNKRALAAAGQPILMHAYKKKFDVHNIHTAQILVVEADFDSTERLYMFRETVDIHLEHGLIPIINENDIASRPEHLFGDNDQLAAEVACAVDAKMLIILSDIAGYYDKNPKEHDDATIYKEVDDIPKHVLNEKHSANNPFATGGIVTKLKAADIMMRNGHEMFLCSGFDLTSVRSYFLDNRHTEGTLFLAKSF
jgi:glutamate 5-kinase